MPIAKWADVTRFPRKGMIRLGYQKETGRTDRNGKPITVPVKTDYFVCPPEVEAVYGKQPKKLDIIIPIEGDVDDVFPQWYKLYGFSGLKGKSDGITKWERTEDSQSQADWIASRTNEAELQQLGYREMATLSFLLPKVSLSGCYQIITGSFQSVVNINAMIKMIRAWAGRISGIPLHLTLDPQVVYYNDNGQQKKTTIYAMKLEFDPKEVQAYIKGRANAYNLEAPSMQGLPQAPQATLPEDTEPAGITVDQEDFGGDILDGGDAEEASGEFGPEPEDCTEDHSLIPGKEMCKVCKAYPYYQRQRRAKMYGNPGMGPLCVELKQQIETTRSEAVLDQIYKRVAENPTTKEFTRMEEAILKGLINKRGEELLQK